MHKIFLLYSWFIRTLFYFFPDIPLIMRLRGFLYSLFMKKRGNNLQVSASSIVKGLENISIGNNCFFAANTIIDAGTDIYLEDDVMIGYASILISGNHTLKNGSYRFGASKREAITIQFGSWVGANCVILAGANIPPSSCIAAGTSLGNKLPESGIYYRKSSLYCKK